jgi:methionine synthase II (cobalamin-independent)
MKTFFIGILITVVGGLILKFFEGRLFSDKTSKVLREITQISDEPSVKFVKVDGPARSEKNESIDKEIESLIKTADKAYGSSARNAEFSKVVRYALGFKKYDFAINAANKIYGSSDRNEAFELIIHKSLADNNYEVANLAVGYIYGSSKKNELLKKIVDSRIAVSKTK